ncbi:MAG: hypothetical protein JWO47_487 [Candidatus Saccharibacteria bacterium]|nr:hypothetical protein [Candidatus Saccharibacteria bacterium]
MQAALLKSGYTLEKNIEKANIVIAHSGGVFFLPLTEKSQTIVLIGPPYWPGKPILLCMAQKIHLDFHARQQEKKLGYWFIKTFWNGIYTVIDLLRAYMLLSYVRKHDLKDRLPNKKIIIIRNKNDAWCSPDLMDIPHKNPITFFELPGEHDDCWIHPEPYIKILQKFSRIN